MVPNSGEQGGELTLCIVYGRFRLLLFACIFSLLCNQRSLASTSFYPPSQTLEKQDFELSLSGKRILSLGERYDQNGNIVFPVDDEDYVRMESGLIVRYGFSDLLEFRSGVNYRRNTSWDQQNNQSNAVGIESAMLGARFSMVESINRFVAVDVEFRSLMGKRISPEDYDELDKIQLGDEGQYFRVGGGLTMRLGTNVYFNSDMGVVLPGKDLSIESDFDFSLYWDRGPFSIGAGFDGVFSFRQDDYTDDPSDKPRGDSVGITHTIRSVNRNYYGAYGAINLALFKGLRVEFQGGQILGGEFWDRKNVALLNLVYRSSEGHDQRVRESFKQYDLQAEVIKVSPQATFVKIGRGLSSNISKGMRFDLYRVGHLEESVLVASGSVFKVNLDYSIVKILKVFRTDIRIEEGFTARGRR